MFKAVVMNQAEDGRSVLSVEELDDGFLSPEGEVTVAVRYAGLNYKDGLCLNGKGGLIRQFPRIPGVEFAGEVLDSRDPRYQAGDKVIATGSRIGEVWHGGYAEKASVKADWLVPLPDGLDLRQSMIFGTAGITAVFALQALESHGLSPDRVRFWSRGSWRGGVLLIALLAALAMRWRQSQPGGESGAYLRDLGAGTLVPRAELAEAIARPGI